MSGRKPGRDGTRLPGLSELRSLRARLASEPDAALAEAWPGLAPFERVIRFKLLEPDRALRFFARLSLEDQIFLIQAAEPGAVAPVLESVPEARAEFHELSPRQREEMLERTRS